MSYIEHAKRELKAAGFFEADSDYGGQLPDAVLELLEVFGNQGHSGASAPMVTSLFTKLALFQPLSPLTGEDSEWNDVSDEGGREGGPLFQNNRCGHVFKDEGGAYDIDGRVFVDPDGMQFTRGADSAAPVTFPYVPTTEYVRVDAEGEPIHA